MRTNLILILLLTTCMQTVAQKIAELEKRNGFKDLKLGMKIDSVRGAKFKREFKEQDEFDAKLYSVDDPFYEKIGEVAVRRIEIKTYKDQVYFIEVITEKDPRLMKALESLFGQAEYDMRRETYFWRAPSLTLKFKSFSKNELQLTFASSPVYEQMKQDRVKKVQDIADDF